MAISLTCPACKSSQKPGTKKCPKCDKSLVHDVTYRVRIKVGDKWASSSFRTLKDATAYEARLKAAVAKTGALPNERGVPTLKAVWDAFEATDLKALAHPRSWTTRWHTHISPRFGESKLDKIGPMDLRVFLAELQDYRHPISHNAKSGILVPLAPSTIKKCLQLVGRLYNFARKNQLFDGNNPVEFVEMPEFDNKRTNVIANGDLERLISVLEAWKCRMPALAFYYCLATGKRAGEVFGLTWDDVDFENALVSYKVKSVKIGERQTLPMSDLSRSILMEALRLRVGKASLVFHTETGKLIHYGAIWRRIKAAAGLDKVYRVHDLRHTFASHLANSGNVDIYTLQNLLGQKQIQMTQRYSHLFDGTLKNGLSVASGIFGRKKEE